MKRKILITALASLTFLSTFLYSCDKDDPPRNPKADDPDVAVAWMNMYLRLTRGTAGFNSIVSGRAYAYAGLALYESIVPGMHGFQSITPQLSGNPVMPAAQHGKKYHWPASANAAMALISKKLFANTTPALVTAIDSLENALNDKMKARAGADELQHASEYGKQIANTIFEWSKTDGGHEPYLNPTSDSYVPPVGPGLWVPTPPAFGKPLFPFWGNNRSFIQGIAAATQPAAPLAYSESPKSDFYMAVKEVYDISNNLKNSDTVTARFWADLPGGYSVPTHATNIVTQLVLLKKLSLQEAAILYCKHGIAGNDGLISSFKTKYKYNLLRPVTYIRSVLGYSNWNPVLSTPAHPEYASNHAIISSAFAEVLEDTFGKNFSFTDNTYESLYGLRHLNSFRDYAEEGAFSRLVGGIHYRFTALEGLKQGERVGKLVNKLRFKK